MNHSYNNFHLRNRKTHFFYFYDVIITVGKYLHLVIYNHPTSLDDTKFLTELFRLKQYELNQTVLSVTIAHQLTVRVIFVLKPIYLL